MSDTVGVRELRQNLSIYLRRVQAGERLIVTERNLPVAELVPLGADDPVGSLVSSGRLLLGEGRPEQIEPIASDDPYAGSHALAAERAD